MQMITTILQHFAEFRRDYLACVGSSTNSHAFAYLSRCGSCERDSGKKVDHSNPLDAMHD
jgi:hypothetical protein